MLDLRSRRVRVDDRQIDLTAREFSLLEVFMLHPDQVMSREQLLGHVWGVDFDPGSNVVEVCPDGPADDRGRTHRDNPRDGLRDPG